MGLQPQTHHSDTVHESSTAKEEGASGRIWAKCARTEQKAVLLRNLLEQELGTRDIENFAKGQSKLKKAKKNQARDVKTVVSSLKNQITDADLNCRKVRKVKNKERKKYEEKYGNGSTK